MSFLIGIGVTRAVVVLFLLVELFGEVQDERDETIGVRFLPQAWCRGDATAGIGGAGVAHEGEVLGLAPRSCVLFVPGSQCSEVCALRDAFAAFFGGTCSRAVSICSANACSSVRVVWNFSICSSVSSAASWGMS